MLDITGQRFNLWTIVAYHHTDHAEWGTTLYWECVCDCGVRKPVAVKSLRSGKSRSCGCLRLEENRIRSSTHHLSGSPIYRSWNMMIQRCTNSALKTWPDYGGRGISVDERWRTFENFNADMGPRPGLEYSLDRIDVDGDYMPGNVQWATRSQQSSNKRRSNTCRNGLHLMDVANTVIRENGSRGCRECRNASARRHTQRKRDANLDISGRGPNPLG